MYIIIMVVLGIMGLFIVIKIIKSIFRHIFAFFNSR